MRMPVEVELFRNHKHSTMGKELRAKLGNNPDRATMRKVYHTAQQMVDDMMETIASQAKDGQIDATDLDESSQEMLALYLEHQVRMLRPNTRNTHTLCCSQVSCVSLLLPTVDLARGMFGSQSQRGGGDGDDCGVESSHGVQVDGKFGAIGVAGCIPDGRQQ